jgi:Protein of unknown function (DUF3567)
MNLVYNSDNYSVVEYPTVASFELIDKLGKTCAFISGDAALKFRNSMQGVIALSPTVESIDEFLDDYEPAVEQHLTFH